MTRDEARDKSDRKEAFNEARTQLRKAALDVIQAVNYLEDYKYAGAVDNIESGARRLDAGLGELRKLI